MVRTISWMVRFFLSTTSFCCGEYGVVRKRLIPCSSEYSMNFTYVNSPPLSDRTALICLPVSFSTINLTFFNASNAFDFSCKKYTHAFREKSSMKEIKYFLPLNELGEIGPHKSICIRLRCSFSMYPTEFGNLVLVCFSSTQSSQNFFLNSILGSLSTMSFFDNSARPPKFKCPYRKCHIMASSFTSNFKHFFYRMFSSSLYIRFFFISTRATNRPCLPFKYSTRSFIKAVIVLVRDFAIQMEFFYCFLKSFCWRDTSFSHLSSF